jgi:endonuclease/exonuclease/phosphatase family metal-dependent hydrolase
MNPRRMLLATLAVAALLPATHAAAPAPASAGELVIATYNLRYASNESPNAWPDRRPAVKALLDRYQPDLIGTQEGLYQQLKDIAADQPAYAWIGVGRDGGSHGEFMAIFYRQDRFEPLEYDHFWLSDTPAAVASTTWGNAVPRMVTWARFRDRLTGHEFYFWNTHLDHEAQLAREKSARLIKQRISKLPADVPVFLVGDFNAVATANRAYDILAKESGLADTWFAARERRNEDVNSFTGFSPLRREGQRIDWILARGAMDLRATEVVTFRHGEQWPSDHLPVVAWVTLQ